ncbi:hypothetical protein CASFOL_031345 [Castilleja foliolosa]|uniref:Septum-promoting GTP-binding protein 1 n=1 Tax=Castilleja foliolosa TaxID=1961234 RepID=A0ABD3C7D1_9LAMI
MHILCKKTCFHFNLKKRIIWRISILRRYIRSMWTRFRACCSIGKSSARYRHLPPSRTASPPQSRLVDRKPAANIVPRRSLDDRGKDSTSDLVTLKISLFGDCRIGKTSFLMKYAGEEKGGEEIKMTGINHVDKTLNVEGARISYSIWEVGGHHSSIFDQIPAACNDSVAMLFMFDLTSRCTLNSVIQWYQEARKCNQNAIPVLIGTKFDDFIQLPIDLQWTIASQARSYAKAMNATLFFSSATYNINVNKIFKFITAKLFNLNWNLERNLTIGEPIIDF